MIRRVLPAFLFVLGLVVGVGVAHSGGAPSLIAPKKFAVGVGAPRAAGAPILRGTTAPGGTLTVNRTVVCFQADGSRTVGLLYANATSQSVSQRTLFVDAACTKVTDNLGNVVSSTGPTTECSAASTYASQLDSTIASAAAGGKLNL
jgi:hypothetical protein